MWFILGKEKSPWSEPRGSPWRPCDSKYTNFPVLLSPYFTSQCTMGNGHSLIGLPVVHKLEASCDREISFRRRYYYSISASDASTTTAYSSQPLPLGLSNQADFNVPWLVVGLVCTLEQKKSSCSSASYQLTVPTAPQHLHPVLLSTINHRRDRSDSGMWTLIGCQVGGRAPQTLGRGALYCPRSPNAAALQLACPAVNFIQNKMLLASLDRWELAIHHRRRFNLRFALMSYVQPRRKRRPALACEECISSAIDLAYWHSPCIHLSEQNKSHRLLTVDIITYSKRVITERQIR